MLRLILLLLACAAAKTAIYEIRPGVCEEIRGEYIWALQRDQPTYMRNYFTPLLASEIEAFYQTLYPNLTIGLRASYENCNLCAGREICTSMGCPNQWWTILEVRDRPADKGGALAPLISPKDCPDKLRFVWTGEQMRARWRWSLERRGWDDEEPEDEAMPPLAAEVST
jgi:hypothetical protein